MTDEQSAWKPEFAKIGEFVHFSNIPGEEQGNNFIKMIHTWADKNDLHRPPGIAVRLIQVPPNGSIPAHTHKDDNGSSWLVCLAGRGIHWVEIAGRRTEHIVSFSEGGVSTQKMAPAIKDLTYVHGFEASDQGLILLSIYNEAELSEETLREIQMGKQSPAK